MSRCVATPSDRDRRWERCPARRSSLVTIAAVVGLLLFANSARAEDAKPAPEKPAGTSSDGAAWRDAAILEKHLAAACDAVEKACGAKFEKRPTVRVATREALIEVIKVQAPEIMEKGAEKGSSEWLDLVAKSLLGLYDPEHHAILVSGENAASIEKALPLPGLAGEDVLRVALVHEATHALDWPRWGWRDVRKERTTNDGRQAFAAVAEGHAQLVAEEVAAAWGITPAFERMTKGIMGVPETLTGTARMLADVLVAEISFGYVQGHRFLQAVRDARGAAAVDAFLKAPPAGTAVVEHPEHAFDAAPAIDLELLVKQLDPLVGDAAFTVARDRVREALIKSQANRLPAEKRDGFARGYEDGRAIVGHVDDEGMVVAMVLRFATPEDARAFVDADREISKASDAQSASGPIRVVESTLTEGAGPDSKLTGFASRKTVIRMGDDVQVSVEDAVLGAIVVSVISLGIPDVNRAAMDAALARVDAALRDPEAARKAAPPGAVKVKSIGRALEVKVVGPDGAVIPKVRLHATWSPSEHNTRSHTLDYTGGPLPFRIPAVKATLVVWDPCDARGERIPLGAASVDVDASQTSVEVRLGSGVSIAGHVVDEGGKPVQGVLVAAVPDLPDSSGQPRPIGPAGGFKDSDSAHAVATSGADGAFRLDPVGDMRYWLVVRTDTAGWTAAPVRARGGESGARVVAVHAQNIEVTVLGPDEKPVPDANVDVRRVTKSGDAKDTTYYDSESAATTGADGVASLKGLRADGEHRLEVDAPRDRDDLGDLELERWKVEAVTVHLPAGRRIQGTVRGVERSDRVSVSWSSGGRTGWDEVQPDGRFTLRGAPVEEFEVSASLNAPGSPGEGRTVRVRVPVGEKRVELVFRPERIVRIAGLAKGDMIEFQVGEQTWNAWASAEGSVTVPEAITADECTIWVAPSKGLGLLALNVRLDGPPPALALLPTTTITGHLKAEGMRYPETAAIGPGRVTVVGRVEEDGSFSIDVPPGHYTIRGKARTDAAWVYGAVEVDAGATDVEVRLEPKPR